MSDREAKRFVLVVGSLVVIVIEVAAAGVVVVVIEGVATVFV